MQARRFDPGLSTWAFYAAVAGRPALITGFGASLRFADVAAGGAGADVRVWDWSLDDYVMVPCAEAVERVLAGDEWCKVIDQPLGGQPLGARLAPPAPLRSNWLSEMPEFADFAVQVVMTPAGAQTPAHTDGCYQGWATLCEGRKDWSLWSPRVRDSFYVDGRFVDPPPPTKTIRQLPGETVYFPAGWVHEVVTAEASISLAGSVLNEYDIVESVRWWHVEREGARLDLPAVVAARLGGTRDEAAIRRALSMIEAWEANR
jgi:hypothetical protein